MSNEILFYDLPSRGECKCWSPNTWKTRIVLNFKAIPYKTDFVPFHQLQEKLKATGIPPNEPGVAMCDYSVPAIRLPDGTTMMDSIKIAHKLEELHPTPSLHLDIKMHEKVSACTSKALGPLVPVFMPIIGRSIVLESDEEWFEKDRSERFGMSLAEFEKTKGGQHAWNSAKPGMEMLKALFKEEKKDEGPFIMGSVPTYGDLVLVGMVKWFKTMGIWEKFREEFGSGELDGLWEGGKQWVEKDD